ncbi:hypothetical protein AB0H17_05805 [Streptomyces olivoreticuli]
MSKPTSVKTTAAVRDRLRVLARERGATITELLEELTASRLTGAEQEQRAVEAARELGVDYTEQLRDAGRSAWEKIRTHHDSTAA